MAQLPVNFDATQVPPAEAFAPIPADWYKASITGSELKPTAGGDGSYVALEHTILEGEFAGRKIFNNLNLVNKNQTAQDIAYRELSAICHAVGVFQVTDTQVLHGLPLELKVGIEPARENYDARNNVKGYRPIEGAVAAAPAGAPGAAPAWAGTAQATAAPTPPQPAAPTPAPAAKSGLEAAVEDGWIKHPSAEGWHYKGQDVKSDADVAAMYPAAPVAPSAPPAPAAAGAPPWAPAQATAAATPAASAPASTASASAPPPWAAK